MDDEEEREYLVLLRGAWSVFQVLEPSGLLPIGIKTFLSVGEPGLAIQRIFRLLQRHKDLGGRLSAEDWAFLSSARASLEQFKEFRVPTRDEFEAMRH